MNVTTKRKMDLQKPDQTLSIDAVQGDTDSRCLELSLYSGTVPWMIPEGITAAVRYCKPDQTRGYYDALPEEESVWRIQENKLTVSLAPQMLTVPGTVHAQVEMVLGTTVLSTFRLKIFVEENPAAGILESEDYINWLQWIQDQAKKHTQSIEQAAEAVQKAANAADANASASEAAAQRAETAATVSGSAAEAARAASTKAVDAAVGVTAIVAGNEAYTKREGDLRYSPSIVQARSGKTIAVSDSAEAPLQGLKIYGKIQQNGTPSPDSPVELVSVGNGGTVGVSVCGKNLLPWPYLGTTYGTGLTFVINSDGSITVLGVAETECAIRISGSSVATEAVVDAIGTFHISGTRVKCKVIRADGSEEYLSDRSFTLAKGDKITYIYVQIKVGETFDSIIYPQLEYGSAATAFIPPKPITILTLSTPNGLPGIPVDRGGNYTDENGQRWICDEVDFQKGMYVQRLYSHTFTGEETFVLYDNGALVGRNFQALGIPDCRVSQKDSANYLAAALCNVATINTQGGASKASVCSFAISQWSTNVTLYFATKFFGGVDEIKASMAKAYANGEPWKITYELAEPIETALTEADLAAYSALHTQYPNTTILNDAGAHMDVEYVADTKLYVDNKFTELAAVLLNNV